MKKTTKDLTTGNLYKNFFLFAIPLVLSALLSQTFGLVDTVIAGRFIGEDALSATGVTSSFHQLFNAPFWGFYTGLGVYTANLFGAKRYHELRSTVYSIFLLSGGLILLCSALSCIFRHQLFAFLKVDPQILDDAMRYFLIVMCAKIFTVGSSCWLCTLHSMGNSIIPFWVSLLCSVLNLVGNIITITVFNMGVTGIAVSTFVANGVAMTAYFLLTRRAFAQLLKDAPRERFRMDLSAVRHAIRYSAPVCLQQISIYICSFGLSPLVNALGKSATAGYTIANRVYNLCQSFYINSSRTVSNYIAQCTGAGRFDRITKGVRVGFFQGLVFLALPLFLFVTFPQEACGLFFKSDYSGDALLLAVRFCRVFLPFVFFAMIDNQFHAIFRGFGAMRVLISTSVFGAFSRLILSYCLNRPLAMDGIYLAWVLSWILEAILVLFIFFRYYRTEEQLRLRHKKA